MGGAGRGQGGPAVGADPVVAAVVDVGGAATAVERHDCPNCGAPAGSACRPRGGKITAKYHTARFGLVPALREELDVPVPADRGPGRAWRQGPALAVVPASRTERAVRIGYARTSAARQELASQLEALRRAECHKIFQEQISTRVKIRPELQQALALAHQFKEAAPETPMIITVHELERLARNAAELMTLSADLQAPGDVLTPSAAGCPVPREVAPTRASELRWCQVRAYKIRLVSGPTWRRRRW
jgi:resolvase-like protein